MPTQKPQNTNMHYRPFKGDKLSALGFGCMRFPTKTPGADEIDWPEAEKLIDYAYQNGVTYFDTAYPYHGGESESFTGHALSKYPRSSFYLATKMPTFNLKTPQDMHRIFEEQLARTGLDYFDYYLVHALSKERFATIERLGLYSFLQEKKRQGYIRHIGFSFHDTPEALETICKSHQWDFAQIQLNYLDWTEYQSQEQYEILKNYNIPCIIMEPVRGGQLADLGQGPNQILQSAAPGKSVASWAMRYAASLENVLVVLSGMSNMSQTKDNVATFSPFTPLAAPEEATLQAALALYKQNVLVPCTACRYCMPCPAGVDIPAVFVLFNKCALNDNPNKFQTEYAHMPAETRGESCVNCGQCVKVCPQHIPIPDTLAKLGQPPIKTT